MMLGNVSPSEQCQRYGVLTVRSMEGMKTFNFLLIIKIRPIMNVKISLISPGCFQFCAHMLRVTVVEKQNIAIEGKEVMKTDFKT